MHVTSSSYQLDHKKHQKIRNNKPLRAIRCLISTYPYRSELTLQPVFEGDEQYEHSESFSYENLSQKPDECVEKTCHRHGDVSCVFKVNLLPVRDTVMSHSTQEEFDQPYVLHLWPTVLLRNLLPYPITYSLMVSMEGWESML